MAGHKQRHMQLGLRLSHKTYQWRRARRAHRASLVSRARRHTSHASHCIHCAHGNRHIPIKMAGLRPGWNRFWRPGLYQHCGSISCDSGVHDFGVHQFAGEYLRLIVNQRGVPPGVGRIGNPPYAERQSCWPITANPREPFWDGRCPNPESKTGV